jgi:acetyl esterase/lipase
LVGGLGTSSGGHLLLLNVLRPRDPRYSAATLPNGGKGRGQGAELAYAIVCWPVADPLTRYRAVQARGNDRLVQAHHAFWPSEAAMEEGSPQHILERGEPVATPPALIMQGTEDDNLTPDMAERFAAVYAKAGGVITAEKFPGQPHAFIPRDPTSADSLRALDMIKNFVHRHGAK